MRHDWTAARHIGPVTSVPLHLCIYVKYVKYLKAALHFEQVTSEPLHLYVCMCVRCVCV